MFPCVLLFFFLLAGCLSMTKQEKTENILSAPNINNSLAKSLESNLFVQASFPCENWWEEFHSPILNQWIEKAFIENPTIHSVESRIEQARQTVVKARSKLLPTLFFNADDDIALFSKNSLTHLFNESLPLHGYEVDLSLSFQYEFDFWSKYKNIFRAAIGETKAREAELQMAKLVLATSLTQSYFALLIAQSKQELYKSLCEVRQARLDLQNRLFNSSLLSKIPSLHSDELLQEAKQSLASITDVIETEKHLINILIGQSPDIDSGWDNLYAAPLTKIALPGELSLNLLSRRPDLSAQIWRVEALSHLVAAAKADFFPNINLAAFSGLTSVSWGSLFSSSSKTAGITPAFSLPIFTAGSIRAGVREKKALFDQAVFDYNDLVLLSVQEVCDLLVHIQTVFAQKTMQEKTVHDAQRILFLTKLKVKSGLDSSLSPLDYEEDLIFQKIQDLNLLYGQYTFAVKLIKALGGGYQTSPPIATLKDSS